LPLVPPIAPAYGASCAVVNALHGSLNNFVTSNGSGIAGALDVDVGLDGALPVEAGGSGVPEPHPAARNTTAQTIVTIRNTRTGQDPIVLCSSVC
jgi:hypothetical protein